MDEASEEARRAAHHCHARGCKVIVRPEILMCKPHWFMVPYALRHEVWRTYHPGQCDGTPLPSEAWHRAADAAIAVVFEKERRIAATEVA